MADVRPRQDAVLVRATSWPSVLLAVLVAATIELAWIELLEGPIGQINAVSLQWLTRETLLNISPVLISLVFLLRCGPLLTLLAGSRGHPGESRRWRGLIRECQHELWQGWIGTGTLFVYFLITILVTVMLCKAGGQPWLLFRRILSVLQAGDLLVGLSKTWLFSGMITLICCHQGFCSTNDGRNLGLRLSDALLFSTLAILSSALLLHLLVPEPPL